MTERIASLIYNLPNPMPESRTYCIVGQGRGGTTMMAELVDMLGVPLTRYSLKHGEKTEDIHFQSPILKLHNASPIQYDEIIKEIEEQITTRNEKPIWAWKIPQCAKHLPLWHHLLRNPFWIYIERDHMASAFTEVRLHDINAITALIVKRESAREYHSFIRERYEQKIPVLLVSYERARIFKGKLLLDLINFLGTSPNVEQITKAVDYIKVVGPLQKKKS